jgi:hypothetical protein
MTHQEKLNIPATAGFCLLLEKLHSTLKVTLESDDLLLTLEFVDPLPKEPPDAIGLFRLTQDSTDPNDRVPHIDMTFHVTDRRKRAGDFGLLNITPVAFHLGTLAIILPHAGDSSQAHPDSLVRSLRKWLSNFADDWIEVLGSHYFAKEK